jgi:ribulose-bisphosphate carboxylase large chain
MQFGGGIPAHPMGTVSGAAACRQAVDASLDGISFEEYAKTHSEL